MLLHVCANGQKAIIPTASARTIWTSDERSRLRLSPHEKRRRAATGGVGPEAIQVRAAHRMATLGSGCSEAIAPSARRCGQRPIADQVGVEQPLLFSPAIQGAQLREGGGDQPEAIPNEPWSAERVRSPPTNAAGVMHNPAQEQKGTYNPDRCGDALNGMTSTKPRSGSFIPTGQSCVTREPSKAQR